MLSCVQLFCDSMVLSLPDSSVHGILWARILEWVAILPPGDLPRAKGSSSLPSPALTGKFFTSRATWEAHYISYLLPRRAFLKKRAIVLLRLYFVMIQSTIIVKEFTLFKALCFSHIPELKVKCYGRVMNMLTGILPEPSRSNCL